MIVIGADSHKRSHTVVAVDQVGRRLGERTVATASDGHLTLLEWSASWPQVTFALEDCRHLTRRLDQDLLAAGQRVVRVPTRLMAAARRASRQPGKSDPINAEAVALAALRHQDLPVAALDGPTREVKLLVDYRRDLVRQRTRVANRLRWHLHELDRALQVPSQGLRRYKFPTSWRPGWPAWMGRWPGWPAGCWPDAATSRWRSTPWRPSCGRWYGGWRPHCWPCPAVGCWARP